MGIQKDVEAVSFSGGNEVQRESFASKIINVKSVLYLYRYM